MTYLIDKTLAAQTGDIKIDFVNNGYQQGFAISSAVPLNSGDSCGGGCSC